MEKLRILGIEKSPEYWLRAVCFDCGWQSQRTSSLLEIWDDMHILQDVASTHEDKFEHKVKIFSTKNK